MHGLPDLARLNDERRLHALANRNEVMVYCRNSQQTGYGGMLLVDIAVG